LAGFSTEVAAAKAPLRPLLSTRNPYLWTVDHDQAFEAVKLAAVESGFPKNRALTLTHICQFWSIRDQLSTDGGLVLYGSRIVIPLASRRTILTKLHAAHQGIVRTKRRAQQTVYWPGITNDVTMLVERCATCQERLASQGQEPLLADLTNCAMLCLGKDHQIDCID
jgi:hypothetical protein